MSSKGQKALQIFREFDTDQSGSLDRDELTAAFKKLAIPVSDAEFEIVWKAADADGSGEIQYSEFAKMLKRAGN